MKNRKNERNGKNLEQHRQTHQLNLSRFKILKNIGLYMKERVLRIREKEREK